MPEALNSPLHDHILHSPGYYAVYERYQPDEGALARIAKTGLRLHVRIYYSPTCGECIRHIPALARIAEHLPGWTWELILDEDAKLKEAECALSTPIIAVSDGNGRLLGAINGTPVRGSLEADLLHIVLTATQEGERHALHPADV